MKADSVWPHFTDWTWRHMIDQQLVYNAFVTHKHNGLWKGMISQIQTIVIVSDC